MKNRLGPKTYYIKTLGCQMNYSDSERICSILEMIGLRKSNLTTKADIIIYNTCSVRQSAEDRIFGLKKNIQNLKDKRGERAENLRFSLPITIVTGCMTRRSWDKKINQRENCRYLRDLKKRIPWADIILDIENIHTLPRILFGSKQDSTSKHAHYLNIEPRYSKEEQALIPISTGCDEFCTYCIVPKARGKQINRSADDIFKDIKSAIRAGSRNIMLLGQNVNSWENNLNIKPSTFIELLKEVDSIKGDFFLSFLSSHPYYFTNDLMDYFTKSITLGNRKVENGEKLDSGCHIRPYLNLALQSGSNRILKTMNRKYKVSNFVSICKKLRENIPNLNLSTDIIVGFPGETERDFIKTVRVFKELDFDMAYINKYSPRKGTAAATFRDNIPLKIKKARAVKLNEELKRSALKRNKRCIGSKARAIIKTIGKNSIQAKIRNFKDIRLNIEKGRSISKGDIVDISIQKANTWNLEGEIIA